MSTDPSLPRAGAEPLDAAAIEEKLHEKRLKERARRNGMAKSIEEMRRIIPALQMRKKSSSQAKVVATALSYILELRSENQRLCAAKGSPPGPVHPTLASVAPTPPPRARTSTAAIASATRKTSSRRATSATVPVLSSSRPKLSKADLARIQAFPLSSSPSFNSSSPSSASPSASARSESASWVAHPSSSASSPKRPRSHVFVSETPTSSAASSPSAMASNFSSPPVSLHHYSDPRPSKWARKDSVGTVPPYEHNDYTDYLSETDSIISAAVSPQLSPRSQQEQDDEEFLPSWASSSVSDGYFMNSQIAPALSSSPVDTASFFLSHPYQSSEHHF
eukprot:TRINITY_DN134_c0_g1_i3.p1 TRINITY_DN134_c0_g1~~TRINITY_DN134_c0_g1_i3.p1  ORF type:complete len:335 (+),score=75.37 TRINITY_DN134_c0_g1_i3:36-1040(+)